MSGPITPHPHILTRSDGATIAYDQEAGRAPGVLFLHGLRSDRGGTKAEALRAHCRRTGRAFLAIDMFGHGQSSGDFAEGGIGRWTEDAVAALDALTEGPQILVGSSMGGWVMVRAAAARPERVAGLIGIAAAPDFTEDLMWPAMAEDQKAALLRDGRIELPSEYDDEATVISRHLIEDGRAHLVLRETIPFDGPVRLLQGQCDPDVPWHTALALAEKLRSDNVVVSLIKDGDHRLSRPEDITRLCRAMDDLVAEIDP